MEDKDKNKTSAAYYDFDNVVYLYQLDANPTIQELQQSKAVSKRVKMMTGTAKAVIRVNNFPW